MNNIVIIGFMGVGKGRTARQLAEMTGLYAVDTDDLIESKVKMKIRHIFSNQGEPVFRSYEKETAIWLETCVHNTIISTGGGFFKVPNLKKIGTIVYLHSGVEEIIEAIAKHPKAAKKIKKRPLLSNLEQAKELFAERLPAYRKLADLEINVERKQPEETSRQIMSLLNL